jgi:hypothetical protein
VKYLLAASTAALLVASPAIAQEPAWTKDEITAGVRKVEYTRRVPAGKQLALEDVAFLNIDCTVAEDAEVMITKEPQHGVATIDSSERFPNFAKDNPRYKCNERKVKSRRLNYKPAVGYVGDDQFEVQEWYANGMVTEYTYHIKVVGPAKGGRADIRP